MSQTNVKHNSHSEVHTTRPLTQAQISQYHRDGYVIVRGLFDPEEVKLVQAISQEDQDYAKSTRNAINHKGQSWNASLWTGLNNSLVSVMTQTARMVDAAEALLGNRCYNWHSKIVQKPPHDEASVDWHQGYWYWYNDGCLFPDFVTCTIAITENSKAHGCLQIIKKSHLMGRIDHVKAGSSAACDPQRMDMILEKSELINCEMNLGDVVFFHANTIHGSQGNTTDDTRTLMHCHYNSISNQPFEKQNDHPHVPLEKLPDSAIKQGLYTSSFEANIQEDWGWYSVQPD